MRYQLLPFQFALLVLPVLVIGCSRGPEVAGVKVTAVLLKKGEPFVAPEKYETAISFVGTADKDGRSIAAPGIFDAKKNVFDVPGPTGHGLPPGTYRITVRCAPYAGKDEDDLFKRVFLIGPDAQKPWTPLTCTISEGKAQEVTIDLGNKQVTTK